MLRLHMTLRLGLSTLLTISAISTVLDASGHIAPFGDYGRGVVAKALVRKDGAHLKGTEQNASPAIFRTYEGPEDVVDSVDSVDVEAGSEGEDTTTETLQPDVFAVSTTDQPEADIARTYGSDDSDISTNMEEERVVRSGARAAVEISSLPVFGEIQSFVSRHHINLTYERSSVSNLLNPLSRTASQFYPVSNMTKNPSAANSASSSAPMPENASSVDAFFPGNSTVIAAIQDPRNKLLLIVAMVLNTMVAALLYLGARIHSRSTLVPSSKAQLQLKSGHLPPCAVDSSGGSGDAPAASSEVTDPAHSHATSQSSGQCRGFDLPGAWRDPTVDLHIGDTSFAVWSARRRAESLRRLGACAALTAVLLCSEVSIGVYLDSLALMSNGFHLLTDVVMYASLFVAVREADRAGDRASYSFGLHRLEVVGVLAALLGQYMVTGNLIVYAVKRLLHPHQMIEQAGEIICLTSTVSLIVNSSLAFWLSKTSNIHSHSHAHGGMAGQMAWLHLVCDAVQNGLVIVTGGLLWIDPSLHFLDSICTFAFALLVFCSTFGFLRQLLGIVMERAPADLDCEQLFKDLEAINGVIGVHCCHAWSIASSKIAVSAHFHIEGGLHEDVLQQAQIILRHRYGIHHVTLQISDDEDLA